MKITAEHQRLEHYRKGRADWKKWGPYLSERSWGTVMPAAGSTAGRNIISTLTAPLTHSYMKMLYKYPQAGYPYTDLVSENRWRGFGDFEYELLDTGVFDDDRYFDVWKFSSPIW
ncbi:hypothetical protein [uncultured Desulfobacter sp.]|uniref:hypothetical protein n=1 Tax=uncultured Desulfobacter sp. TaxID=240139 RepID=UPI0029F57FD7|nr:hypothetical protein [uncultured Desulfobacter sp.]